MQENRARGKVNNMYKHLFAKNYREKIHSIIRVDHAGEHGAIKIYQNQIKGIPEKNQLKEMLDSEIIHFEYFCEISSKLGIKPTLFLPIWSRLAGFMGYATAKSSLSNAMLCTHAVEDVIEKHYQKQIHELKDVLQFYNEQDSYILEHKKELQELLAKIEKFMLEEIEHKNIGEENSHMNKPLFTLIRAVTKLAVIISERV